MPVPLFSLVASLRLFREEDVFCGIVKCHYPSHWKAVDNHSNVIDFAVHFCRELRLGRLTDALQKIGLNCWKTKTSKF